MSQPIIRVASGALGSPEPVVVGGDSNDGTVMTQSATKTLIPDVQKGSYSYVDGGLRSVKELVAAAMGTSLIVCLLLMM
jgi:hypothetical protein